MKNPERYIESICSGCRAPELLCNGKWLLEIREHFEVSRQEVCKEMGNCSQRKLKKIENGERKCSAENGDRIAMAVKRAHDKKEGSHPPVEV